MTALALPRPKKLWLPKFEPWRLLKPLKLDGQFAPSQYLQFLNGLLGLVEGHGGGPVSLIDDGDSIAESSGGSTSTHTHSSEVTTGPVSVIAIQWFDTVDRTLSSITWNSATVDILVQAHRAEAGVAIGIINGAQTGDVVLSFNGAVARSSFTKISLVNLQSLTPIDTDSSTHATGDASLAALSSPGEGGIRIASYTNTNDNPISWTNATEIADYDNGPNAASVAYDLGDDGTTITADIGATPEAICGVSLR